ncbi:YbjN domain-containing protein [Hyphomicrobium sp. CS1BSMeth3]|uniref:YbjN domain-containing protein n=1 Tax=Hyphomicrobium sp. CS1BSMeth3 TaxID=1892844 RepID=UPI0015750114
MHAAGYRVEVQGSVLRSATGGLPFEVRFGNPVPGSSEAYLDVTFVALLVIQGSFQQPLLNGWNKRHRFGRIFLEQPSPNQEVLVLCLDAVLGTNPTAQTLRVHIDIWDALVQQFIAWLNTELRQSPPVVSETAAVDQMAANA